MGDLALRGCALEPLSTYLKALGLLRLVAEQADSNARGAWHNEGFVLHSAMDGPALCAFMLEKYAPSPVIAPWNGGSGFFPKDTHEALDLLAGSSDSRFAAYRHCIQTARAVLAHLNLAQKPEKDEKERLLQLLRAELPDVALDWLDAAVVLTGDGPKYPPLLGTGGNDGRLEFTNNHMQRLGDVLLWNSAKERDRSAGWLEASLFGTPRPDLRPASIGQFNPSAAGGANAGPGFDREARVNPWDYVLMIEGALMFASAATKRLESSALSGMAFPFMVAASGVGYASAAAEDERSSRNELWLPVWTAPASVPELQVLFSEGRAKVGDRDARTGVDFARAISSLGVDRGIKSFTRYCFQNRNGRSYFATPLGRLRVERRPQVDLLAPLDRWLADLRRQVAGEKCPASLQRAVRALDSAILEFCSGTSSGTLEILVELGRIEGVLSRVREPSVLPVPALDPAWLGASDDGSLEFSLARTLASSGIRERMVRVRLSAPLEWHEKNDGRTIWGSCGLVENLIAVIQREEIEESRDGNLRGRAAGHSMPVELQALQAFIDHRTDDVRLEKLLRGLALVDFARAESMSEPYTPVGGLPSAAFAMLALAHSREPIPGVPLPRTPGMTTKAASGNMAAAVALASRRLRGAGLTTRVNLIQEQPWRARRTVAALAFPLGPRARSLLSKRFLVPEHQPVETRRE
jgi:CRISPR-associated protein Csx17